MILKEITDKNIWENFLISVKEKTFLQSWNWGELQKMTGDKIWHLGVYENDELISIALVIKIIAKRGTFLFLHHGPIMKNQRSEISEIFLEELKKIAKEEKADFIRIATIWESNDENIKIFRDLGFRKASIHIHPEATWKLDISPSEEELLMQMRKTTRYLIRQAQKNQEIEVFQSQKLEDIETFNNLHQEVVKRQHFIPFSLNYFKKEVLAFNPDNQISIFFGKYENEILVSAVIVFWQGIAFYHHGASSLRHSKIPVSYLLQWEVMKEAKKRGCSLYNFWGIAPEGSSKRHPWTGLTLFKKGFGGYIKEYVETQDFVLSQKYWLNWIIEKIRKKRRGF